MFWNKKKSDAPEQHPEPQPEPHPEPTEEQLKEEAELLARMSNPTKRTSSGETTKILHLAFDAMDKALQEKRDVKEAAKKLQESVAKAVPKIQVKKPRTSNS